MKAKLKRDKTFTYMIVHDVKHPTESLIKILSHCQDTLQVGPLDNVLKFCDLMRNLIKNRHESIEINSSSEVSTGEKSNRQDEK